MADPLKRGTVGHIASVMGEIAPEDISEEEILPTSPTAVLSGSDLAKIDLSKQEKRNFVCQVMGILKAYDEMSIPWRNRIKAIDDAYNLVSSQETQGLRPDASRLVSEITRTQVKLATARIYEAIRGVDPFVRVSVSDVTSKDPQTSELVQYAKAAEAFFQAYMWGDLEGEKWLPLSVLGQCKIGTQVLRCIWEESDEEYLFKDTGGKVQVTTTTDGNLKVEQINAEDVVVWPVSEPDIAKMIVVGHRFSFTTPNEFRSFCSDKGCSDSDIDMMLLNSKMSGEGDEDRDRKSEELRKKGFDVANYNPLDGNIEVFEGWGHLYLKDDDTKPMKFQCFIHEKSEKLIWVGRNTLNCRRHPYFALHYWREQNAFWSSGIGQDLEYVQAGDSALLNMAIDNLKQMGNHLRLVKTNSNAEMLMDQIAPGMNLPTENPAEDFITVPLGGDLQILNDQQERLDARGKRLTGLNDPAQGTGDKTLKSGASPTSQTQLIVEASRQFKMVDSSTRSGLGDLFEYMLLLLQQYATEGLYYRVVSQDSANLLDRLKYIPPRGDLKKFYRVTARAPSAATNREVQRQSLMILSGVLTQFVEGIMSLSEMVWGQTEPYKVKKLGESFVMFSQTLLDQIIDLQDLPGLADKKPQPIEELTQPEQLANQLMQQNQQLIQQLQEMQGEMERLGGVQGSQGVSG